MKTKLLFALIIFCVGTANGVLAQASIPPDINAWIDKQFTKGLDSLGIVGAAIVLVQNDTIIHKAGYGVEDVKSQEPIDPDTSIFTVASISKTITATAVMQLYEQGKIDLDVDINEYLKSISIPYPYERIITVRHLLTHTAGFDERNLGTKVHSIDQLIPLAEHLEKRMPPQIRNAGEVFDYSNYGYALLGLIVEDVSGIPFSEYIQQYITQPLGMKNSGFTYDTNAQKNLVTSYLQKDGNLTGYDDYLSLNYPAGGFHATAGDMGNYLKMYLNQGSLDSTQLLQPQTIQKMWTNIYQNLPESRYGWGLGFEYYDWRGKKIMGHGGDILGFATDLRLLPDDNLGIYVSFNSSSIPGSVSKEFLNDFWGKLLKKLYPESQYIKKPAPEISQAALPLSAYEGTYRFTRYAQSTLDKLAVFIGFAPEITILQTKDSLRIKEWNTSFYPTGRHTFFSPDRNGYVAFGKSLENEIDYFYLNGTEGYHKLKFYDTVKFQMVWIGVIVLLSLIVLLRTLWLVFSNKTKIRKVDILQAVIAGFIFIFLGVVGYTLSVTDPQEFLYGIPAVLRIVLYIPFLLIGLILMSILLQFSSHNQGHKIIHVITTVAFIGFIWWLYNWNLLGFNF